MNILLIQLICRSNNNLKCFDSSIGTLYNLTIIIFIPSLIFQVRLIVREIYYTERICMYFYRFELIRYLKTKTNSNNDEPVTKQKLFSPVMPSNFMKKAKLLWRRDISN